MIVRVSCYGKRWYFVITWRTPNAVALPPLLSASSEMLTKNPAMATRASLAVLRSLSSAIFSRICETVVVVFRLRRGAKEENEARALFHSDG